MVLITTIGLSLGVTSRLFLFTPAHLFGRYYGMEISCIREASILRGIGQLLQGPCETVKHILEGFRPVSLSIMAHKLMSFLSGLFAC